MRNKIFIAIVLCFCSSSVFAKDASNSLFNCLNLNNYAVSEKCTSSVIGKSDKFQAFQKKLALKMEQQNPNELATMQFNQEKMQITVIAHKEIEEHAKLLTAVSY